MDGLTWKTPPEVLVGSLERQFDGDRLLYAVAAVLGRRATIMGNDARKNAPWQDRTGNARSGLFATTEVDENRALVILYLSHGVSIEYGKYLELAHQGRYAIIMRTIEQHADDALKDLKHVFGD